MKEYITCTRKFEWDAGHRVLGHEGKCRFLHGHRYTAEVTFRAGNKTNELGMVVDFGLVKEMIGSYIDQFWDHNLMIHQDDPLLALGQLLTQQGIWKDRHAYNDGKAPYVMRNGNPTAENIAHELYDDANASLARNQINAHVIHVRVYETPNCFADYSREEQ